MCDIKARDCIMHVIHVILLSGIITPTMGYDTTHIANAYYERVLAKVATERSHIEDISISAGLSVGGKLSAGEISAGGTISTGYSKRVHQVWNKFIDEGFMQILPTEYFGFSPTGEDTVYMSIWCVSQGFISNNVPVRKDVSYIVKSNGAIVKSKYGDGVWKDESGHYLKPSDHEVAVAASRAAKAAKAAAEEEAAASAAKASSTASSHDVNPYTTMLQICVLFYSLFQLY